MNGQMKAPVHLLLGVVTFILLVSRIGIEDTLTRVLVWVTALFFIIPVLKKTL